MSEEDWVDVEIYELFGEYGVTVEEVYEQSGLVYPTNPQKLVTLLKKVGLLVQRNRKRNGYQFFSHYQIQ